VEVQEPTDFSVLLEWRGFEIDGSTAGHLGLGFDVALDALDRSEWSPERVATLVSRSDRLAPAADGYFRAERLHGGATLDPGYSVVVVLHGSGALSGGGQTVHSITAGQTWVTPFSAGELELTGRVEVVRCRPPA
jgi:mannose-6-phosphate isomerase